MYFFRTIKVMLTFLEYCEKWNVSLGTAKKTLSAANDRFVLFEYRGASWTMMTEALKNACTKLFSTCVVCLIRLSRIDITMT
jgi:hypothetical protein